MHIRSVGVCGAGTMGSGIAQVSAVAGFSVVQYDLSAEMLERSKAGIEKNFNFLIGKGKMTQADANAALERILFTSDLNDCRADLFIEAIIESEAAKVELFQKLMQINGNASVYATNTSSISVTSIAEKTAYPETVAGLHFFNPAPLMKLTEVIRTKHTDETLIASLTAFAKALGKTPVVCKDVPGFIVNRVARHYYLEAMQSVQHSNASIEDIDLLCESAGFKMGPFKLMDLIGMDINYSVSNIVWDALGKPKRLTPSIVQKEKVDSGKLGKKTGEGFYKY